MKVSIVFAVMFVAVCAADDWKVHPEEELMAIRAKCLQEHKVPPALVEKMKKFDYVDDPKVRCALKCVAEGVKAWDNETGWILDRFYEQATDHEASVPDKENLKKCIDARLEGEDDCKWIYRNFKCMLDNKYVIPKQA